MKTIILAILMISAASLAQAQERTAGQGYEAQVNWSALNSKIDLINTQNKALAATIGKMQACNNAGKIYAPAGAKADANGCVATSAPMVVNYKKCTFAKHAVMKPNLAGRYWGTTISTQLAAEHYCPTNTVMVGVNNKSVDSAVCCELKTAD